MPKGVEISEALYRDEPEHVRQYLRNGCFKFLSKYLREYLSMRKMGINQVEAFNNISFEIEARAAEANNE